MAKTPHPSGLNRKQRRDFQRTSGGGFAPAISLDPEALKNRAMLQEFRVRWCENCQEEHHEEYCATCSKREGRIVYHLKE